MTKPIEPGSLDPERAGTFAGSFDLATAESDPHVALVRYVNKFRVDNGTPPLSVSPILSRAAQAKAQAMADKGMMAHELDGVTARQNAENHGYPKGQYSGENILWGQATAEQAFAAWQGSPPHRANMLSATHKAIGVGGPATANTRVKHAWAQVFGRHVDEAVPDPEPPPAPPEPPKPAYVADANTPWRLLNNTDRAAFITQVTKTHDRKATSPLTPHASEMYDVAAKHGLSRFLPGILWVEQKNWSWPDTPIPAWCNNPYSMTGEGDKGTHRSAGHSWAVFSSPVVATRMVCEKLLSTTGPYNGAKSIAEFFHVYAPSFENNTNTYIATVIALVNALPVIGSLPPTPPGRAVVVAGSPRPVYLPADVAFETVLTPIGGNRPGGPGRMLGFVQHETGNPRSGTGARMHSQWQDSGTPGHPDGFVGVHFYVDDERIIQKIPINEEAIHAGYPANQERISSELCVNSDRNVVRAERNAAMLAAGIIRDALRKDISALTNHNVITGGGYTSCPAVLRSSGRWASFVATVANLIADGGATAPTFPGLPSGVPVEILLDLFPDANPTGPVTKAYIAWCVEHGLWPRHRGWKSLPDGRRWWDFSPLIMLSDSKGVITIL